MIGLTVKQAELLTFIENTLSERNGIAPSFEEMKLALGLKSKSGVHRLIQALEERGFIRRLPNKARAMELAAMQLANVPTDDLFAELRARGFSLDRLAA